MKHRITKKIGPSYRAKKKSQQPTKPKSRRARRKPGEHHRLPVSRAYEFGKSPEFDGNVKQVPRHWHEAWHTLFYDATPAEVIVRLQREGRHVFLASRSRRQAWHLLFQRYPKMRDVIFRIESYWMGEEVAEALGYTFQYWRKASPEVRNKQL